MIHKIVTTVSLVILCVAVIIGSITISRMNDDRLTPQGVCVTLDSSYANSNPVISVETPTVVNNVVSCLSGSFVSVNPRPYQE